MLAVVETARADGTSGVHADTSDAAFHPGRRTAAIVVAGASTIALGIGVYAGIRTFHKRSDSDAGCPTVDGELRCTEQGATDNRAAQTSAIVANVAIGVGVAGALIASYLWLTAGAPPKRTAKQGLTGLRVLPTAEPGSFGGSLTTAW